MPGQNSTIKLSQIVDAAMSNGDTSPALPTGGWSDALALDIANDVMSAFIRGGPNGEPLNFKFNRFNVPPFPTIGWQQDYFVPGVNNIGWIEYCWASAINVLSIPKQMFDMEVHRDLAVTFTQTGYPGKICWIPNDQCLTGTWGQAPLGPTVSNPQGQFNNLGPGPTGVQNPGPGVIYTNPIGVPNATPVNATTCIKDAFGNLWTVTTYGTCGNINPFISNLNPVYPTWQNPNTVATTVTDGTTVWTAINPKGQGFRINPLPPQTGLTWLIQPVCQMRAPLFTSLSQYLEPIPDDYHIFFKQGFFAQCYRRHPDPKIRARFTQEWELFLKSLDDAVKAGQREMDDFGFYPTTSVMDSGQSIYLINFPNAGYPWPIG